MLKKRDEAITFPVGTVVLQYVDDNERSVAVVVGNHMENKLSESHRHTFEMHRDDDYMHILLVLSYFKGYEDRWSTFAQSGAFQFPTYVACRKGNATKADLSTEIALVIRHENEEASRGTSVKLHSRMFCFSEKQREALELVALIEHFMKRGTLETVPEWIMRYHRDRRKIVFDELSAALYP